MQKLLNKEAGTVFGSVNRNDINDLEVDVPDEVQQGKIALFLLQIDEKIENNEKINRNLLEQNIAIMKELADDAIGVQNLKSICNEIYAGGTPSRKKEEYWSSKDYTWFKNGEVKNNIVLDSEEHISEVGLNNSSAKLVPANSVLFAMYCVSDPQLAINLNECTTNQAVCSLIIKDFNLMCFIYYYMQFYGKTLTNLANGAAQQNLNKGMIESFEVNIPLTEDIEKTSLACNVRLKMELAIENQRLKELRDLLLPKLMSGELDVSELNI